MQGIRSIQPFVFDVSKSYKPYWDRWIPEKNQAIYHIPGGWKKKFHVICLHYVLEHVPNPVEVLKNLQHLLKDDGVIYISVPNFLKNVGDIFVVDHINKFTVESIDETARLAGYRIETKSTSDLDNAFSCTLKSAAGVIEPTSVVSKSIKEIRNYLDRQKSLLDQIRDADRSLWRWFLCNIVGKLENGKH